MGNPANIKSPISPVRGKEGEATLALKRRNQTGNYVTSNNKFATYKRSICPLVAGLPSGHKMTLRLRLRDIKMALWQSSPPWDLKPYFTGSEYIVKTLSFVG